MAASNDPGPPSRPASFEPLRPATRGWRAFILLVGPLLWVVSLIAVAYVVRHREAVEIALVVVGASLLVAILLLVPMRVLLLREEESA